MEYKVKSDYTILRKRRQRIEDGSDIFENNLMTISQMDDLFASDQSIVPTNGSNFRFSVRTGWNETKKHARRGWVLNPDGEEQWTLGNTSGSSVSEETLIRIKPDYSSLRDFAYYGSAVKMVQAAVTDVVLHFPAEMYFSEDEFFLDKNYYLIHNGYGINADTMFQNDMEVDNPLRYLCLSSGNYDYYENGVMVESGVGFDVKSEKNDCPSKGAIIATATVITSTDKIEIFTYQKDSDKWLIYKKGNGNEGKSIRPCKEAIDNFFNEIDDFEYVLLNRATSPVYRATFETPYETDYGNYYSMQDYIWPSFNDWNPDVETVAYSKYVSDLVQLATFHDQYDSDNLWRMNTHEAIKNLDWTFFRENGDSLEDLSEIDSSKVEAMIQIYGRNFDGVKRYTDNIKNTANISYNQKNNIPDYHLTDIAELAGWEVLLPNATAQTDTYSETGYNGRSKGWNESEANSAFVRNLKLNARYLNSLKGTRYGLHAVLGLLGLHRDEYTINEKIAIAKGKGNYCDFLSLYDKNNAYGESMATSAATEYTDWPLTRNIASILLNRYDSEIAVRSTVDESDEYYLNMILGDLSVKTVSVYGSDGNVAFRYCVPWYDNTVKYDGDWYFQSKGGWGKRIAKEINYPELTSASTLNATKSLPMYEESNTYLKFAADLTDLTGFHSYEITEGDVCYVTSLEGIQNSYSKGNKEWQHSEIVAGGEMSHYFILKDFNYSTILGSIDGLNYGWRYIPLEEIRKDKISDEDAFRVIYLETLKEQTEGNNPHNGFGEYDFGEEYKEYIAQPFKYLLDNSGFTMFTEQDIVTGISKYNYDLNGDVIDNKKCWYFSNLQENYTDKGGAEKECCGEMVVGDGEEMGVPNEAFEWQTENNGEYYTIEPSSALKSLPIASTGNIAKKFSETAADSVVNLKNVTIHFNIPEEILGDEEAKKKWKHYINDIVIEYVKQMLPSTTIWEYSIEGDKEEPDFDKIEVSPKTYEFENTGGTITISIISNKPWTASTMIGTLSKTEGNSGASQITLEVGENTDLSKLKELISFTAGTAVTYIEIVQKGADNIIVMPTEYNFTSGGGKMEITIESNKPWAATTTLGRLSKKSGDSGSSKITLTVPENEKEEILNAVVSFTAGKATAEVTITQDAYVAPDSIVVDPTEIAFENMGGSLSIVITANKPWAAVTTLGTLSQDSGDSGETEITLTVPINAEPEELKGTVTFTAGTANANITILQNAAEEILEVIPNDWVFSKNAESADFEIESNTKWFVTDYPSWVTAITPTEGEEEATLTISVDKNDTMVRKTGTIILTTAKGKTAGINVAQRRVRSNIAVSPTSGLAMAEGDTLTLTVTSEDDWTANFEEPISSVVPSTGKEGDTNVTVKVCNNRNMAKRNLTVSFETDGTEADYTVEQAAGYIKFIPSGVTFNSNGGIQTMVVSASTDGYLMETGTTTIANFTMAPNSFVKGQNRITLTASANTQSITKKATIVARASFDDIEAKTTVWQKDLTYAYLVAGSSKVTSITAPLAGLSQAGYTVSANCGWQELLFVDGKQAPVQWAYLEPEEGTGTKAVKVTFDPYRDYETSVSRFPYTARTGVIVLTALDDTGEEVGTNEITVNQVISGKIYAPTVTFGYYESSTKQIYFIVRNNDLNATLTSFEIQGSIMEAGYGSGTIKQSIKPNSQAEVAVQYNGQLNDKGTIDGRDVEDLSVEGYLPKYY